MLQRNTWANTPLLLLLSVLSLLPHARAWNIFFNNTANVTTLAADAQTISTACFNAMTAPVNCDGALWTLFVEDYYGPIGNATLQNALCSTSCPTALNSYRSAVKTACAKDLQPFPGIPATYWADAARATYNLTCLKDPKSGQYCTDYIANAMANITTDSPGTGLPTTILCSSCFVSTLRQLQSTSFSNYNLDIASQWSAIQKQCTLSYPTATQSLTTNVTGLPNWAAANATYSTSCLSGKTYKVVSGDTCSAIAARAGVATRTLISLNAVLPDCSNLQVGQVLCLPQTCSLYTVKANDTCYKVADKYSLLYPELLSYNPTINTFCSNLIAGDNVCVSPPGGNWTGTTISGATVTQTGVYASATVAAPGTVAYKTTPYCGKYYQVKTGDYCQLIALNYTISLPLFLAINPSINAACDNLIPALYYCILPTSDWNATTTTTTSSTTVAAPTTTPSGTTKTCYAWYTVKSGDTCSLIDSAFNITFAQLQAWNPQLNSACTNLLLGDAYCVNGGTGASTTTTKTTSSTKASSTTTAAPKTTTSSATKTSSSTKSSTTVPAPTSTASGATSQCYAWYTVQSGDTCSAIDTKYSITFAQLQYWNPSLNSGCTNLLLGYAYCVNGAGSPSKRDFIPAAAELEVEVEERAAAVVVMEEGLEERTVDERMVEEREAEERRVAERDMDGREGGVPVGWPYLNARGSPWGPGRKEL